MNEQKIIGVIQFLNSGDAYVKTTENKEIFVYRKNTLNSLHQDTVSISTFEKFGKLEGQVEEVIERSKTEFVGRTQVSKNNLVFVIPDNPKCPIDFLIPPESINKAINNQKVLVRLKKWKPGTRSPYGEIIKILGNVGSNNAEMNSIMYEYNLPIEFPKEVEEEANNISTVITNEEIAKRRDMRDTLTITIDPKDAKDFDDALSIKYLPNNIYEIGIHIADVTHYITPNSLIDKEAINRSTSVYLVDRCIPMLPHKLSNELCSLRPNEDKLSYSVVVKMNDKGEIIDKWFGRTVIHSNHRFTYEQAQTIIESKGDASIKVKVFSEILHDMPLQNGIDLVNSIQTFDSLAKILRKKRTNSIEMNTAEVRFNLDDKGKPLDVYFKIQKDANKLIEEFMLLANQEVSKLLSNTGYPSIYRNHDTPNVDKLETLRAVCQNFGYELNTEKEKIKESLNNLLHQIKGSPEETMISTLATRSMSKAVYESKNIGHYGLGFTFYSHFTSPIRRYSDCILHHTLTRYLDKEHNKKNFDLTEMDRLCSHLNVMEGLSSKAQRDSIKYKQAEFLKDKIGESFTGMVSGITDWGVYVEIVENKCECLVKMSSFKGNWTRDNYIIKESNGKTIKLGDEIAIMIDNVNLDRKIIEASVIL